MAWEGKGSDLGSPWIPRTPLGQFPGPPGHLVWACFVFPPLVLGSLPNNWNTWASFGVPHGRFGVHTETWNPLGRVLGSLKGV